MPNVFRDIFDNGDDPKNERSKFLSRLFGIFSEKVVSIWARDDRAPFEDLGRPTLKRLDDPRGHTLDFSLRERATNKIYVAEMKCEIEYFNFRYFVLNSSSQLDHHRKPAFDAFLCAARHPTALDVRIRSQPTEINGAILIWGAVDPDFTREIISKRGFHDILSIERIQQDLVHWQNQDYLDMVAKYRTWSNRLFDGLLSAGPQG